MEKYGNTVEQSIIDFHSGLAMEALILLWWIRFLRTPVDKYRKPKFAYLFKVNRKCPWSGRQ